MSNNQFSDMSATEIFPVVDEQGHVVGRATRQQCHSGSMLLHPVVHLHVLDEQGRLLLQRRSTTKFIQPGKWDTAVGGHIDYGETVEQALRREVAEEIGLTAFEPTPLLTYVFQSQVERELVNTFVTRIAASTPLVAQPSEVDELRFWTLTQVEQALGQGILTPNFEHEFKKILPELKKQG